MFRPQLFLTELYRKRLLTEPPQRKTGSCVTQLPGVYTQTYGISIFSTSLPAFTNTGMAS